MDTNVPPGENEPKNQNKLFDQNILDNIKHVLQSIQENDR